MPFDFCSYRHYSINYSKLFDDINSKEILNNKVIQTELIKRWMESLESEDKTLSNQLKTKEDISRISLLLQSEPEVFQIPMYHKDNTILLHFRASIANQIFSKEYEKAELIDLNEFIKENSSIMWTPAEANDKSRLDSQNPIIMVPFISGQYRALVIDGNHRLTNMVKHNINNVHALYASEQTVIECKLFSSGFDKLYYIMNNELCYMANETYINKNVDPLKLAQKSYLNGGTFKFL